VSRALEIISRIEELGGHLAVETDGTIRFRLPKDHPEAQSLLNAARADKESILAYLQAPRFQEQNLGGKKLSPCGSASCAGCYDVGDGRKVHPPKCGEDYRVWLARWEAKGKVQ